MRRWSKRILLGLLILIVIVLITVQVVFWTDYPRRLVLSLVQQNLGLRIEATQLSTGWFGSTSLQNVKLSLPLAPESFFDVPRMEIEHTGIFPLLVTRHFEVKGIELRQPQLVLRRGTEGKWNLEE